jgi:hypothetical protein
LNVGSSLLGWVKDDAEYIAQQIDAFAGGPPSQGKSAEGASAVAQHS